MGFPGGPAGKQYTCNVGDLSLTPGKIPWRRERLPTPGFWPGEFHRLHRPWGHKESNTAEWLSLHYVINTYYLWSVSPSSLASWKCCLSFSLLNAALLLCNLHTQKEITSASCRMNKSGWIALISTFSWSPRLTSSETAIRLVVADLPSLKSSLDWRVWMIPGVPHQVPRIAVFRRELFSPSSFFGVSWLPSISESEQSKAIALVPQVTV